MITRQQALDLLHKNMQSINLRRHSYAVEVTMKALAKHFGEDEEMWGIAGLLHDADYEITKEDPKRHTHLVLEWLNELDAPEEIKNAILAHGWGYVEGNPEPKIKMEWSIYCCDELTGFIVAVALTRPEKKLSAVTVDAVKKKLKEKSFAKAVNREQIGMCEEKLGIKLDEFINITLVSMHTIADELGL